MPPYFSCDNEVSTSDPAFIMPNRPLHKQQHLIPPSSDLVRLAAQELESMRQRDESTGDGERSFPPACLLLLRTLEGNDRCADCSAPSPDWAGVSYGTTLCVRCAGPHRSLGVGTSFVKSLSMDSWKRREVLCMLEGGNRQLAAFLERHGVGVPVCEGGARTDRYRTKAASFYRQHLKGHARGLAERCRPYEGREASRRQKKNKDRSSKNRRSGKP